MDAAVLLANSLSPDTQTRQDATRQLEAASRENYPEYMSLLSAVLVTESAELHIRIAAGLALKNALSAKDALRQAECTTRWLSLSQEIRERIKRDILVALGSTSQKAGEFAAHAVAAIAKVELPHGQWTDLIGHLLQAVNSQGNANLNVSALQTIGFICEVIKSEALRRRSSEILRAVIYAARKGGDSQVQLAAIRALVNSLEFLKDNFDRDDELNYILHTVCEVVRLTTVSVKAAAFECLARIMGLYYDKIGSYTGLGLFTIAVDGLKHSDEHVVLQAIGFWSTIFEEEQELAILAQKAAEDDELPEFESKHFAQAALPRVAPILLDLLVKQEECFDEDEWNVPTAARTCLSYLSQAVQDRIVSYAMPFIEMHIRSADWRFREAAVMAFGSILDGPDPNTLVPSVTQALPLLIEMMADEHEQVRDSTARTLGGICDILVEAVESDVHLHPLISALVNGLQDEVRVANKCANALGNLAESWGDYYEDEGSTATTVLDGGPTQPEPLLVYYDETINALLRVWERSDIDYELKHEVYKAIDSFISVPMHEVIPVVQKTALVIVEKMEHLLQMLHSMGDAGRSGWHHVQGDLCNILVSIIYRLEVGIQPLADRIMTCMLAFIQAAGKNTVAVEEALWTFGSLASVFGKDIIRYCPTIMPTLYLALTSHEDAQLCICAVRAIGELTRALREHFTQFASPILDALSKNLQSESLDKYLRVCCLSCFGDIAVALGPRFEPYLSPSMDLMRHASTMRFDYLVDGDLADFVNQYRCAILIAYTGMITAFRATPKVSLVLPYVPYFLELIQLCYEHEDRADLVDQLCTGLLENIACCLPKEQLIQLANDAQTMVTGDMEKAAYLEQEMARCELSSY